MRFESEAQLGDYLSSKIKGKWQRIETTTGPGVPDIFAALPKPRPFSVWLELKVVSHLGNEENPVQVEVRPAQFAWIVDACMHRQYATVAVGTYGGHIVIVNWYDVMKLKEPVVLQTVGKVFRHCPQQPQNILSFLYKQHSHVLITERFMGIKLF